LTNTLGGKKERKKGLGLCVFYALVCDLLPRRLFHGFAKGALPEDYLSHNFEKHCLEDTRLIWCLSYPRINGAPPRARGGEGALAPSRRAPHGHDQTPGEMIFFIL